MKYGKVFNCEGKNMKKRIGVILLCILLIVSSLVIFFPVEAVKLSGNTFYVGGSGPGNYTKIQDAINDSSNGDTVLVYRGVYYENIVVNKTINLIGEDRTKTVIDGGTEGCVITLKKIDGIKTSGFTIHNGKTGIYLLDSSNNNITGNNIQNNTNYGIYFNYFSNNNNIINDNIIQNNKICIYMDSNNCNNIISNNIFKNNIQAIYFYYSSNNIIIGNDIQCGIWILNEITRGIYLWGSTNDIIKDNNIHNISYMGIKPSIGISLEGSNITIIGNNIQDNSMSGISSSGSDIIITCNNIQNNGEGLLIASSKHFIISDNNIQNNRKGIRIISSEHNIPDFIISGNNIQNNTEYGIYLNCPSVTNYNPYVNYTITGNIIKINNVGVFVYQTPGWKKGISNNIISNNNIGIELKDSSLHDIISNNISNNEYGVYIHSLSNSNEIKNNNFINNQLKDAYFENSFFNIWNNNYWDQWNKIGPKKISGKFIQIIPLINFDWHPAREPYDIT
ncbi:MAG: hypothetical protein BV456_02380 [Thermoplasmata archaeon M8B2D]|nr:MAG: hypothetical protein BV456_02380 [Thermoplasmata archaeon M8B2D]